MNADQFRRVFNANDHLLKVTKLNGAVTFAVGLNGANAVMHDRSEIPLSALYDTIGDGLLEVPDASE